MSVCLFVCPFTGSGMARAEYRDSELSLLIVCLFVCPFTWSSMARAEYQVSELSLLNVCLSVYRDSGAVRGM